MHATLGIGVVAGDVPGEGGGGRLGLLLEDEGALDVGVTTEDGNCDGGGVSDGGLGRVTAARPVVVSPFNSGKRTSMGSYPTTWTPFG